MMDSSAFSGRSGTQVALALLRSLKAIDTPTDPGALGESDLPLVLQRRLGLSSVINNQIRRYEAARAISGDEVTSLFELVGRRPDAKLVFGNAGRLLAQGDLDDRGLGSRLATRTLPRAARRGLALRRARKLVKSVSPGGQVGISPKNNRLEVIGCYPARAVEGGPGCAMVAGAIERILSEYGARGVHIEHSECEGATGERCVWHVAGSENGHG